MPSKFVVIHSFALSYNNKSMHYIHLTLHIFRCSAASELFNSASNGWACKHKSKSIKSPNEKNNNQKIMPHDEIQFNIQIWFLFRVKKTHTFRSCGGNGNGGNSILNHFEGSTSVWVWVCVSILVTFPMLINPSILLRTFVWQYESRKWCNTHLWMSWC